MGRQLRIEYPGAFYHVMSHGNGSLLIHNYKKEINEFIQVLFEVTKKYNFRIHAFVFMPNHYHMLIETPDENLSKGMCKLNNNFAKIINYKYNRKGSAFQQRYKAILIEKEYYYFTLIRYLYQNPVRANISKKAELYPGSSLYYLLKNKMNINSLLYLENLQSYFGQDDYLLNMIDFVNKTPQKLPQHSKCKYLFGTENWTKKIKESYVNKSLDEEISDHNNLISKKFNEEKLQKLIINEKQIKFSHILAYFYAKYSSITQKELANRWHLNNRSSISKKIYKFKLLLENNEKIKLKVKSIERKIFI